jgi:hypothetical protein
VTKLKEFFFFFYEVFKASLGFYCYSKLNKAQAEKLMGSNLAACCIKMRANNFHGEITISSSEKRAAAKFAYDEMELCHY